MLTYQFRPIDQWPGEKTRSRKKSLFSSTWSATLDLLERELGYLRAKEIVIQAGVEAREIRNDGMLRASARPSWPGIILSFESKHGPLSYPCDTFADWQDNVRAIALSLGALRAVERYGVTKRAEQYQGWAKLPPPPPPPQQSVLTAEAAAAIFSRIGGGAVSEILRDVEAMKAAYRRACLATHPDHKPGFEREFRDVQNAKAVLDRRFGIT